MPMCFAESSSCHHVLTMEGCRTGEHCDKNDVKAAQSEVKNGSFAQRSTHRDSSIWRSELIDSAAERKRCTQPFTSTCIDLSRPIVFATVQFFIQIPRRPIMFGLSESADMCLSFYPKNGNTFRSDFEKFQEMYENLNFRKFQLITKTTWCSTKKSLESPPEVFLAGEPNTKKKKKQLLSISSSCIQPFEEKNKDVFSAFFRLSAHFRPQSGASTPHNFFLPVISI